MRQGLFGAIMAVGLISCGSTKAELQQLRFCPADIEEETRTVLDLGSDSNITLDELFRRLDTLGLRYETATADNIVHKCENVQPVSDAQTYKIYAGLDASQTFSRNYLLVADKSGAVRYIEARYAYRVP